MERWTTGYLLVEDSLLFSFDLANVAVSVVSKGLSLVVLSGIKLASSFTVAAAGLLLSES